MPLGPEFGIEYSTMMTAAETGIRPASMPATNPASTATPHRTLQHCQLGRVKSTADCPVRLGCGRLRASELNLPAAGERYKDDEDGAILVKDGAKMVYRWINQALALLSIALGV